MLVAHFFQGFSYVTSDKGDTEEMGQLFKRGVMTPDTEPIQRKLDYKDYLHCQKVRLERKYSEGKRGFAWALQKAWQKSIFRGGDLDIVYEMIRPNITRVAERYERKYSRKRLSRHEFESALWKVAWDIVEPDKVAHNGFLLLELLELAWERRAVNVVRDALNPRQERFEHIMLSYDDTVDRKRPDKRHFEEEIVNSMLVRQMLEEESLTEKERMFLQLLYENSDASLRELAGLMGYRHYMQAERIRERLRVKLDQYNIIE